MVPPTNEIVNAGFSVKWAGHGRPGLRLADRAVHAPSEPPLIVVEPVAGTGVAAARVTSTFPAGPIAVVGTIVNLPPTGSWFEYQ
jgi:hypothetical protein